jgi:SAM-dependent methyltransferase
MHTSSSSSRWVGLGILAGLPPIAVDLPRGSGSTMGPMTGPFAADGRQAHWNDRYDTKGFVFGAAPNEFVAASLGDMPPGKVLDLGSGQGRNAVWLAAQGHEVTAVDFSAVATDQARQLAAEAGVDVTFLTADILEWEPEPGVYDLVLLSYIQLPETTRRQVHAKAIRALAPGGVVFVIAHHADNLEHGIGGPQYPEVLFTEDDLAADFAGLTVDRLERVIRRVDREDLSGEAIDVLLLARASG